jgi:hypothetical protein
MLAYLFWHWPAPGQDADLYVERLLAFHRALRFAPPAGFHGSRVLAIEGTPWTPGLQAFEDWYLVGDFAALGALNEAAVTASRQAPHDAVARLAGGGAGGLYRRRATGAAAIERAAWFAKPAGEPYAAFLARLPAAEAWQRQMVLGPAPEFCLLGPAPAGVEAVTVQARVLYDGTA